MPDAAPDDPAERSLGTDAPTPTRRPQRAWRLVRRTLLVVGVLLVVATGWLVFRGVQAATSLMHAEGVVREIRDGLSDVRSETVVARLPELEADTARARRATSDPVWAAASRLPGIGPNLAAVATVSAALDDVARLAMPTLRDIDAIGEAQGLRGTDGRIDVGPIAAAAPGLARAADTVAAAERSVAAIDTRPLLDRLAGPVEQVQGGLAEVSELLDGAARFSALLPPMLGADEPRTYLLLSLNSAELRAAGGIVGAVAVLRAENGVLDLVEQRTTVEFPALDAPVLPLTADELQVHSDRLGRWLQNTTLTPDFPRTAELVREHWRTTIGGDVDGVIALDPVAVAYVLEATGAVVEPGGLRLDAGNLVEELLHQSYLRLQDPLEADAFYTGVATTIFRAVGSGQGDARRVVEQLGRASGEHRVRVWSARPDEQAVLAATTVGGAFLSGGADAAAGVFLNDGAAGKLDYFLRTDVAIEDVRCDAGSTTSVVRVDLSYAPPADIADYPRYVTGWSGSALPTGWVATNLTVYAPVAGSLGPVMSGDVGIGGLRAVERGRDVQVLTSWLAPGQRATYRFEVRTERPADELPVWLTPTLTSPGILTAVCP